MLWFKTKAQYRATCHSKVDKLSIDNNTYGVYYEKTAINPALSYRSTLGLLFLRLINLLHITFSSFITNIV